MRTHANIISDAGAAQVRERAGLAVSIHTVRSWQQRDGIPAEYWEALERAGLTTLKELAHAAARSPRKPKAANENAPATGRAA